MGREAKLIRILVVVQLSRCVDADSLMVADAFEAMVDQVGNRQPDRIVNTQEEFVNFSMGR